jgi:pimeloyl-ACP methyl ester carboxylesterase
MVSLSQRMVEVDGATLEVFVGDAEGPAVCQSHPFVALPPAGGLLEAASDRFRFVHVNARGTGNSSAGQSPREYTLAQHVADLETVRQLLGIERWTFHGETGSGCTSLLYALRAPDALSGLVVGWMGASGRRIVADARSVLSPRHPAYGDALEATPLQRHAAILDVFTGTPAEWLQLREGLWVLRVGGQPVMMVPFEIERAKLFAEEFVSSFEVQERLDDIRMPTLVAASLRDPVVPLDECERVHAGLHNSQLVTLESAGHGEANLEPPAAKDYRAALQAFLAHVG